MYIDTKVSNSSILRIRPTEIREEIVSVHDYEAFTAKHMPDLGHDVHDSQLFHWKLNRWRRLERELTSPEFGCGGYKWRILLFPSGNYYASSYNTVSIYLDCSDPNSKEGWHTSAQFALAVSNPDDSTIYTVSQAHHRFTAEKHDWGFTHFSEPSRLFLPQPGHSRPIIEEDSAVVSVYVRVLKDSADVPLRNFVNSNLRKTGYVGLRNRGATDCMNAVLQSFFYINSFRKAIYQILTEGHRPTESIPLALQRIFYNLQTSDQPVDTTELTKCFGWEPLDSSIRHDVQKFNRILQDGLEYSRKGTRVEDAIRKLFVGNIRRPIEYANAKAYYESSRIEEFKEIVLNVKGIKTLYDSFRDYVAVETLDDIFKYLGEGPDTREGVAFQSIPPVLRFQLKRYEYDIKHNTTVKIHDRFEFPFDIDLEEFLDNTADRTKPWKYNLHSVIVHSGDLHDGRYFTLIKPDRDTQWLRFDDELVTSATDWEVLESYGGERPDGGTPKAALFGRTKTKWFASAHMLVYIRETAIDEVLAPLTQEDTPPYLRQRLGEEHVQTETKEREELVLWEKSQEFFSNTVQSHNFLEAEPREGYPVGTRSPQEAQNVIPEPADLSQTYVSTRSLPELGNFETVASIGTQQQRGNFLPRISSLFQPLLDSGLEIERRVNEMDKRLEDQSISDRERLKLFNKLCKMCSRHRVIPKSMQISDCSKGSVEVDSGGYANISQGTYEGRRVAIKVVRVYFTNDLDVIRGRFCRESVAWKHLRHPNILPLLGVTVNGHRFAMVSEWMEYGNINEFVRKDHRANRTELLVDVANGLAYMHRHYIVHGDLKGANILINRYGRACIADFGLSTVTGVVTPAVAGPSLLSLISNDTLMSFTAGGTYRWMSPELLDPERFGMPQSEGNRPTRQSDCYALGMVVYEVLCGHRPYVEMQSDALVINAIVERVRPGKPEGATRLGFTQELWRTVELCWLEDRSARPGVEVILSCLKDATVFWYMKDS